MQNKSFEMSGGKSSSFHVLYRHFPPVLFHETFGIFWKPAVGSSTTECGMVFLHWTLALPLALIGLMLQEP